VNEYSDDVPSVTDALDREVSVTQVPKIAEITQFGKLFALHSARYLGIYVRIDKLACPVTLETTCRG